MDLISLCSTNRILDRKHVFLNNINVLFIFINYQLDLCNLVFSLNTSWFRIKFNYGIYSRYVKIFFQLTISDLCGCQFSQ